MPYIGRDTDKLSNIEVLDNITFDGSSSYTLQKGGSNFTPSSANNILISIDGVVQAGNFTVSSSTIDFGTAVAGTSTCDFILHYGIGLITTPADGTVTTAKLADSSVSLAKLTATGTKSSSTFLRGDNTFAEAGGGKLLQIVQAQMTSDVSINGGNSSQTDIGLSASITPSATSSKVLALVTLNHVRKTNDSQLDFQLVRGSTVVYDNLGNHDTGDTQQLHFVLSFSYLDSPNTLSATTYKVNGAGNSGVVYGNTGASNIILIEVGA